METKRCYLDTNIIRNLGRRLLNMNQPTTCFTSALAIVELLNGVRGGKDALMRFACLRNLFVSRIGIIWALPCTRIQVELPILSAV